MTRVDGNIFTGVSKKRRSLIDDCIRDFFFTVSKDLVECEGQLSSIGPEGTLETIRELFKEGTLQMKVASRKDYVIYLIDDDGLTLIYDSIPGRPQQMKEKYG